MRIAEWIQGGFSVLLAIAAWVSPLPPERRRRVTLLAVILVLVVLGGRCTAWFVPPEVSSRVRDWLPFPLMMIPYWQTGQFFVRRNAGLERRLMALDRRWFPGVAARSATGRTAAGVALEAAYFLCYPLVPLGLGTLYAAGLESRADDYWLVVLVSTYICYAVTPFFPALPPRDLTAPPRAAETNPVHRLNQWLQEWGSIHAISFPSAHVASTLAVALALLRLLPAAGIAFLVVAICIAIAAVVGRYHYALDVVLGAAVAVVAFAAWTI